MILALGTPHRGQMIPAGRLAMHVPLDSSLQPASLDAPGAGRDSGPKELDEIEPGLSEVPAQDPDRVPT